MAIFLRKKNAQSTAEYAIVIGLIVAAAVAMQVYIKRALQGGIKFVVDKQTKASGTKQYEPYYLESSYDTEVAAYKDTEQTKLDGEVERQFGVGSGKVTTRSGYQKIKGTTNAD